MKIVSILIDTWHVGLLTSAILLFIYVRNRKWKAKLIHMADIILGVEAIITAVLLCREAYLRLLCNTDFERTFVIIGFLSAGSIGFFAIRKPMSKPKKK